MIDHKTGSRNYLIFASLFIILSLILIKSFLFGIIWGSIIALSLWPMLDNFTSKKRRFLKIGAEKNAALFTFVFTIVFLLPISYSILQIANIYPLVSDYIEAHTTNGIFNYPVWFAHLPFSDRIITLWNDNIATTQGTWVGKITTSNFINFITVVWGQLFARIITMVVMILTLYFLLKNGRRVKNNYADVFAYWISDKSLTHIDNGVYSLRSTINGIILMGIFEGIILALPLVASGISAGFIIGIAAGIAGVLPFLMPALIAPCILYLFFNAQEAWAIASMIDLFIVWSVFENWLKPQMIGKHVKIDSFIILISMIGGMQTIGLVGLFLGPAIVSMAIGMIRDLLKVPKRELEKIDDVDDNDFNNDLDDDFKDNLTTPTE